MKKTELIVVTIIGICLGTGMHFMHHAPFFNHFLGYIFPINECVWEHMKMLFYPMLLCSIYLCIKEKSIEAFGGMIVSNVVCIPVQIALFYAYEIFTGHSVLVLDVIAYYAVMAFGFWLGNKYTQKPAIRKGWPWCIALAVALIVLIGFLTYNAPEWHMFIPEAE